MRGQRGDGRGGGQWEQGGGRGGGGGVMGWGEVGRLALGLKLEGIVAGFSADAAVLVFARVREIGAEVGAVLFVDMARVAGLVAAGVYPNPVPFADVVTTTTHKTLRGPRGG
ncbi:hypothetical protein B1218_36615, partial [Pseudomonas ogarae]